MPYVVVPRMAVAKSERPDPAAVVHAFPVRHRSAKSSGSRSARPTCPIPKRICSRIAGPFHLERDWNELPPESEPQGGPPVNGRFASCRRETGNARRPSRVIFSGTEP